MNPYEKIIIALDYPSADKALELVSQLRDTPVKYKVGKQLFTAAGPDIVKRIQDLGGYVFLDLKYKDIGATMQGAAESASNLGVDLFNVHTMIGLNNMRSAKAGIAQAAKKAAKKAEEENKPNLFKAPRVIGVTLLTDQDRNNLRLLGINMTVENYVIRLGALAKYAGLDGVVCSPRELPAMRYLFGESATLVTPGIQPASMEQNEQKRVMTPGEAIENGASMMVIGRAITKVADPVQATDDIAQEIYDAMPNWGTKTLDAKGKANIEKQLKNLALLMAKYNQK
ncbi:MAG: orotidine-5'-phosphate decarboxylase [Alphaproteobacteria bacterium]|nr:orotidine-5'-phosphate decarboxylase [Alphaproteobacteria bacterium]